MKVLICILTLSLSIKSLAENAQNQIDSEDKTETKSDGIKTPTHSNIALQFFGATGVAALGSVAGGLIGATSFFVVGGFSWVVAGGSADSFVRGICAVGAAGRALGSAIGVYGVVGPGSFKPALVGGLLAELAVYVYLDKTAMRPEVYLHDTNPLIVYGFPAVAAAAAYTIVTLQKLNDSKSSAQLYSPFHFVVLPGVDAQSVRGFAQYQF